MGKIITDAGLAILANRVKGNGTEPLYIAWGTGTTEPTALDTDLESEDTTGGYSRIAGVSTIADTLVSQDTYQVSGSITAQADLLITEWALFDAINSGNMLCREVLASGQTVLTGSSLNFVFKFQDIRG